MKAKQSLMAALVGIATMIAMPIVAAAGDHDADEYQGNRWQEPGAIIQVGHHYGWRNRENYNPGLICDEDGDYCHPALQCDEDGDDCHYAWPDEDDDDREPSAGYGSRYYDQRVPAYNLYDRDINNDARAIRQGQANIRHDKQELREDLEHHDYGAAAHEQAEIQQRRENIRARKADLNADLSNRY